jgi:hypothetical protein
VKCSAALKAAGWAVYVTVLAVGILKYGWPGLGIALGGYIAGAMQMMGAATEDD